MKEANWEDKIINMDMDNPGQPAKDWFTGTEIAFIEKIRQEAIREVIEAIPNCSHHYHSDCKWCNPKDQLKTKFL